MTRIMKRASLTVMGLLVAATLLAAPEKPRVAVLVFEYEGGATRVEASGIAEEIRRVFVGSNRYTVVDRTLTDQIMTEWRIRQSGLTARQKAIKVGRLYNVQMVVTGKLLKFPEGGWQVSSVMLNAQTGVAKRAETLNFKGGFFQMLVQKVPSMAFVLAGIRNAAEFRPTPPAGKSTPKPAAMGRTYRDPTTGMVLTWINGGAFLMGCGPWNEGDCEDEEMPVRKVRLNGFWMGRYEIRVDEYMIFVRDTKGHYPEWLNPSSNFHYQKGENDHYRKMGKALTQGDHPIVGVTWHDASAFALWLSRKSERSYRLPSEAEWEYACRGGGKPIKFAWGSGPPYRKGKKAGNVADLSMKTTLPNLEVWGEYDDGYVYTAPVGSFAPNALGIHDMTGNVSEWLLDVYDKQAYRKTVSDNPIFQGAGNARAQRGGSWDDPGRESRCSGREEDHPSEKDYNLGFRLVMTR